MSAGGTMNEVTGRGKAKDGEGTSDLEPIAIVGMGCRFPGGVNSPSAFWELLKNGVDAITEVPSDRWNLTAFYDPDPKQSGMSYSKWGGFLDQVDRFDAQFFKISPREAAHMDPQQRLLLEVSWEALEDGGVDIDRLTGSRTGVFVGISTHDFADMQAKDVHAADAYTNTGGALSIAANRLSYCFDFHGPSLAVDTACSSSLVAVHLACQSLRAGECSAALVGGVNCLLTPEATLGFSRAMMLSPNGRCRAFDADANGYVRGEGAGVVFLKPLSAAIAAGDRIRAVIIGSGVNQDGHSAGLTVPSAEAQESLLRDIYGRAGVDPNRLLYFEAHGTGTPVGDPLEAAAVGAALGRRRRPGNTLRIGSLKSNIGHLEAGAGIAGLIKSALLIEHREIPATLHFRTPNPKVLLSELGLRVQHAFEVVSDDETASVVGVNSFGFGGTNAHVALDRAPGPIVPKAPNPATTPASRVIPVSARTAEALNAAAGMLRERITCVTGPAPTLADISYSAGVRHTHHDHRLAVAASSVAELAEHLESFERGDARPGVVTGRRAAGRAPRIAFVFSGMGPQWWAMGRQLLMDDVVFKHAIDECEELFQAVAGWSLLAELTADADRSRMDQAEVAQPANFALQVGLIALWRSWGIVPDAIVGHSAGEVAAAYAAGILTLEDAIHVIYHRSRLQQRATDKGKMLAVGLSAGKAAPLLNAFRERVSLAAVNSPRSVTFTGDEDALVEIANTLRDMEVFTRMLDGRVPYHSHYMDPLKDELIESLLSITPQSASIPFYSVVTGDRADGREVDASYWWSNVREPVMFAPAVEKILEAGVDVFVELGPHPVMGRSVVEIVTDRNEGAVPVLMSLRRETPERPAMLAALSSLYTLGSRVDWRGVNGEGALIDMPAYPWQRERCWTEPEHSIRGRLPTSTHPLLQRRLESVNPTWESRFGGYRLAYLNDHVIQGAVVFPGAAYIEAALAASRELFGGDGHVLEDLRFKRALILREEESPRMQFVVHPQDHTFTVHSSLQPGQAWALNATGRIVQDDGGVAVATVSELPAIQARCRHRLSHDRCYRDLGAIGFEYGPTFRGLAEVWQGDGEALGRIWCPEALAGEGNHGHLLHPAVFDACLQVVPFVSARDRGADGATDTILPIEVARFRFRGSPRGRGMWCHLKLVAETRHTLQGDITLFNDDGEVIAEVTRLKGQRVANARASAGEELKGLLHGLEWFAKAMPVAGVRQADFLPATQALVAALTPATASRETPPHHAEVAARFDRICAAYAWQALAAAGWPDSDEELAPELRRLVKMLETDAVIRKTDAGWDVVDATRGGDPRLLRHEIGDDYPAYEPVLAALDWCAAVTPAVLSGSRDRSELLIPEGGADDVLETLAASPFGLPAIERIRDCVEAVVAALPKGRALRVLELDGGTGSTAVRVLASLPRHRTEYVLTDRSELFLAAARNRLAAYPFVEYARFDVGEDPSDQGLEPHSYDLVIAADSRQLSADPAKALANIRSLLASNGLLLASAATDDSRVHDMIVAPLRDEQMALAPRSRSQREWSELLSAAGFLEPTIVDTRAGAGGAVTLLAREVQQVAEPDVAASSSVVTWLMFADKSGVADSLAEGIRGRGDHTVRVSPGPCFARLSESAFEVRPESPEDHLQLIQALADTLPACRGVVHLWSLDEDVEQSAGLDHAERLGCVSALHLIQALDRAALIAPPRLWLLTRGSQHVDDEAVPTCASQAMLWGFGRVAMNEQPQWRTTLVDLDPDAVKDDRTHLIDELYADGVDQEIAWRGAARFVARIVPTVVARTGASDAPSTPADRDVSFQLEAAKPGSLESLRLREVPRRLPGPGEVEIEIKFAGINFRDVMKAMGMYLDHLGEAFRFGDECAGLVTRVGEGVTGFTVGDEVIAIGIGCFGQYLTTSVKGVVHKPSSLTLEQAATVPMVFLTVHYGLNHVAKLKPGESILIHSAAGGIGLAAVQVAQHVGAKIFATAGSPEKRALLKSMGIQHVMDSRSLAFADEIMAATGGRGLDVVLNSLAGDFLVKSLALLRPTGRFVELGKVDFFENTRLGLAPFRRGLSFLGVDLGYLMLSEPDLVRELFGEVIRMFEEGSLRPLPVRTFPVSEASSAFRMIVQARHTGKLALALSGPHGAITRVAPKTAPFRDDAAYLVTGGLRGFGLAIAEWMVDQGARHLVLVGRSGVITEDNQAAIGRMRDAGAVVTLMKADVGNETEVAVLLDAIAQSVPPLRGVFHAAAVFDDGYLLQLDAERFRHVVAPKAGGAWHLHRHTRDRELDYFVLFSSISSLVGSPGQGNYAAANAYLDALAHHRRALKLPVLTVNWSAISEVGFFARNAALTDALTNQGLSSITPAEAASVLGMLLQGPGGQVAAVRLDPGQLKALRSSEATSRRFSIVLSQSAQDQRRGTGPTARALLSLLAMSAAEARPRLIESALRIDLAKLLGVRDSQIVADQPLVELGIDSLMSVELESAIRTSLGIELPLGFLVSDNVSLALLSQRLAIQSQPAIDVLTAGRDAGVAPPVPDMPMADVAAP